MTTPRAPSRQRGFALLWAMLLVILVGSLGSVVLTRDATIRRDGARDLEALRAFYAAEAGLERAKHELARGDPAWRGGEILVGACRVKVRVTEHPRLGWDVVSEAMPGGTRLEMHVDLDPRANTANAWRQTR